MKTLNQLSCFIANINKTLIYILVTELKMPNIVEHIQENYAEFPTFFYLFLKKTTLTAHLQIIIRIMIMVTLE